VPIAKQVFVRLFGELMRITYNKTTLGVLSSTIARVLFPVLLRFSEMKLFLFDAGIDRRRITAQQS
jgi:hypothetical protein